ncbi:MAG: serpin family protein, partial [Thermoguttaceae bacterium]|nr:serpin family protein [Thermoguttaceae bacterium]
TRKELDAFLERAVGADDWSAQSASVFNALKSGDELTAVGGVWIQKGYDVQDSYLKRLRAFSDMEAFVVDLKESTINRWFDEKTGGRVQNAVKGIKSNTRVVIGDAITFLGKWERSFDPAGTKERPFTEIDGKRVLVPTMIQKANFRYCQKGGVQYVELDYRGGRYTTAIVVPDANMTYQNLENVLNADEVVDWRRSSRSTEMMLSMPKFAAKFDVDMNPVLKKMGVRDAFDRDSADFSAMAANGAKRGNDALYVDQVLQSATIKVNEEGTEAAAATGVLLGAMGLPSYVNLTIDRPFVYFVRENTTGQIVFIGRTVKPTFDPDDPDMKTPEVEPGSRVMPMGMGGMSGGMGGMGIVPGAGM